MNSSAPDGLDTLELGLLHAAPLVWRQGGTPAPLLTLTLTLTLTLAPTLT